MSRRAIPGNFFWGENSEKVIEIKKRGPFGLKFCHSIQTSIHHYKKINLRNWKDFSWENFYIVFFLFLGLNLEIWSSCRQLRAGCPNMFRRTNLGKLFCTRKEKNGISVTFFRPFGRTVGRGVSKYSIQHHQMSKCGKKFWESLYFVYLFSRLEDKILFIWGKTEAVCQIVSRRLVR